MCDSTTHMTSFAHWQKKKKSYPKFEIISPYCYARWQAVSFIAKWEAVTTKSTNKSHPMNTGSRQVNRYFFWVLLVNLFSGRASSLSSFLLLFAFLDTGPTYYQVWLATYYQQQTTNNTNKQQTTNKKQHRQTTNNKQRTMNNEQ